LKNIKRLKWHIQMVRNQDPRGPQAGVRGLGLGLGRGECDYLERFCWRPDEMELPPESRAHKKAQKKKKTPAQKMRLRRPPVNLPKHLRRRFDKFGNEMPLAPPRDERWVDKWIDEAAADGSDGRDPQFRYADDHTSNSRRERFDYEFGEDSRAVPGRTQKWSPGNRGNLRPDERATHLDGADRCGPPDKRRRETKTEEKPEKGPSGRPFKKLDPNREAPVLPGGWPVLAPVTRARAGSRLAFPRRDKDDGASDETFWRNSQPTTSPPTGHFEGRATAKATRRPNMFDD